MKSDIAQALISSMTATANASGASCGRLCPARGTTRWTRRPVKRGALERPSVAGLTFVSATPSQGTYDNVTGIWDVGTVTPGPARYLVHATLIGGAG